MGKLETIVRSEIIRLAKRELNKIGVPLRRDVRSMRSVLSQLRKSVSMLERQASRQKSDWAGGKAILEATPEEIGSTRFSPRLIRSLRKRLGISQKDLAVLIGVTVGAIFQWEKGVFDPRDEKKARLVALRKLGRREVRKLLEEKASKEAPPVVSKKKGKKRARRK